jgi:hypothetical protein
MEKAPMMNLELLALSIPLSENNSSEYLPYLLEQ